MMFLLLDVQLVEPYNIITIITKDVNTVLQVPQFFIMENAQHALQTLIIMLQFKNVLLAQIPLIIIQPLEHAIAHNQILIYRMVFVFHALHRDSGMELTVFHVHKHKYITVLLENVYVHHIFHM